MKTRPTVFRTIATSALLALAAASAIADSAPPTTAATLSLDDVKQHVRKLQTTFGRAPGLQFTEHLGVQTSGTSAGPQTRFLDFSGELTKPAKFKYTIPTGGTLVSDGVSELALDPTRMRYNIRPASKAYTVAADWAFVSTKVLTGGSQLLDQALLPYLYHHIGDKDFIEPTQMQLTGFASKLNGKPVIDINYRNETDDIHLLLDPKTDALVGTHSTYRALNGLVTEVIEDISSLTLLPLAPPATDFATVAPANAVPVPIPVPVTPPPATTIKPKATTPKAQQNRNRNRNRNGSKDDITIGGLTVLR
ncbi:MAG TPA: hypothetical protein VGK19_01585 [Capsulimonadaceae bacterium]|jgi:hypothetical protein